MSEKDFEYHRARWESIPRFELAWVHTDTPAIDYFSYLAEICVANEKGEWTNLGSGYDDFGRFLQLGSRLPRHQLANESKIVSALNTLTGQNELNPFCIYCHGYLDRFIREKTEVKPEVSISEHKAEFGVDHVAFMLDEYMGENYREILDTFEKAMDFGNFNYNYTTRFVQVPVPRENQPSGIFVFQDATIPSQLWNSEHDAIYTHLEETGTPCECGELLALYSFARIQDTFIIISEVDSEKLAMGLDSSGEESSPIPSDFWSETTIAERVWQSMEGFEDWVLSHSVWIGCGICAKPQHDFDSKNLNQIWITYIERELVHASQDTLKRFDDSIDVILRDEEYLNIRDYLTLDLAVLEPSFRALPEITQTYLPKLQQLLKGQV